MYSSIKVHFGSLTSIKSNVESKVTISGSTVANTQQYGALVWEQAPSEGKKKGIWWAGRTGETVDILLMPSFHDTRTWYHDLIG